MFTTQVMMGRIAPALATLIQLRIFGLRQRLSELAERVAAGTYRPRPEPQTPPERTSPATPHKPPVSEKMFRRRGWLAALLPAEKAPSFRAALRDWLQTPEMVALMAAAPKPAARLLRPLCWALAYQPPEILKPQPRRPRPKPARPEKPAPLPEELPLPLRRPDYRPSAHWPRGVPGARRNARKFT